MTMDLFVARSMITKASLVFRGQIQISDSQVSLVFKKHVMFCCIGLLGLFIKFSYLFAV
jgi:endoribonuclease Dicer